MKGVGNLKKSPLLKFRSTYTLFRRGRVLAPGPRPDGGGVGWEGPAVRAADAEEGLRDQVHGGGRQLPLQGGRRPGQQETFFYTFELNLRSIGQLWVRRQRVKQNFMNNFRSTETRRCTTQRGASPWTTSSRTPTTSRSTSPKISKRESFNFRKLCSIKFSFILNY